MLKSRATTERPRQAGGMGQQEHYEIQQGQMPSPAPRKKPFLGAVQAGEQLCRKEPDGPGRQQAEYESAVKAAANSILGYINRSMVHR